LLTGREVVKAEDSPIHNVQLRKLNAHAVEKIPTGSAYAENTQRFAGKGTNPASQSVQIREGVSGFKSTMLGG
jgi:hypothetical protein